MSEKFRNKYRTTSHRRPHWDYLAGAFYFLTMVTQKMDCNLGEIIHSDEEKHLQPSDFGQIVEHEWFQSFEIRNENQDKLLSIKRNSPKRLPKSISSFIAGFKSAVNTKIDDYIDEHQLDIPKYNRNNHFFQPNYYDHIIRNDREYENISNYIRDNPQNWNNDRLYE